MSRTTPSRTVEIISGERYVQAESPRWDGRDGGLAWIDMATGSLHRGLLVEGTVVPVSAVKVGAQIGAPIPLAEPGAGWAVAVDRDFVHVGDDGTVTPIATGIAAAGSYMNDGGGDPFGRFWVGSQSMPRAPHCALWSIDPEGAATERLGGVTVSNGLAFSPTGETLYYIDTLPHRSIEAFDVAPDGQLKNRRTVCEVEGGNPDGMTIDLEGMLWVAVWDAGEVRRYSPSGALLETIELPATRPTAVALVDRLLVITTASVGLSHPTDADGALLGVDVEVGGAPAFPWRGKSPSVSDDIRFR
ncbi:SMP-30/gluconolactonase/LRE family protein [Microbacterium murale]|uniref:Sugar lactone lactonase YvrE n=1 Tax=Microbacterium murale TaxID=1081040 RepID=A0ABU0P776_9MICO|nr:SMP-30/gluconolactonase/LRE family protein [Microbacterium murale]MDQ0643184.1 sugar lactone lactonase YvrE [Microbacterium murale]